MVVNREVVRGRAESESRRLMSGARAHAFRLKKWGDRKGNLGRNDVWDVFPVLTEAEFQNEPEIWSRKSTCYKARVW